MHKSKLRTFGSDVRKTVKFDVCVYICVDFSSFDIPRKKLVFLSFSFFHTFPRVSSGITLVKGDCMCQLCPYVSRHRRKMAIFAQTLTSIKRMTLSNCHCSTLLSALQYANSNDSLFLSHRCFHYPSHLSILPLLS